MQNVSVAETRQHLAEILGKVAYGGETFVIHKKGRPMAHLVPILPARAREAATLGELRGWLDDNDPFFAHLETIREESRREDPGTIFPAKKRKKSSP